MGELDTDEDKSAEWQTYAWISWQRGHANKREDAQSWGYAANWKRRSCDQNDYALRRHQASSSKCLQAQGWHPPIGRHASTAAAISSPRMMPGRWSSMSTAVPIAWSVVAPTPHGVTLCSACLVLQVCGPASKWSVTRRSNAGFQQRRRSFKLGSAKPAAPSRRYPRQNSLTLS